MKVVSDPRRGVVVVVVAVVVAVVSGGPGDTIRDADREAEAVATRDDS